MSVPLTTGVGLSLRGMTKSSRPAPKAAPTSRPLGSSPQGRPLAISAGPGVSGMAGVTGMRTGVQMPPESGEERPEDITFALGTGQVGSEEERSSTLVADQRIQSMQPSRSATMTVQEKLEEYPVGYSKLLLIPVECYSCGKTIVQLDIEDGLKQGRTLKDTMNELRYKRICCRRMITGSPCIIELQKELAKQPLQLEGLTLADTDIESNFGLTGMIRSTEEEEDFPTGPSILHELVIVDEAPPGTITAPNPAGASGLCFTGQGESLGQVTSNVEGAYELFMSQLSDEG